MPLNPSDLLVVSRTGQNYRAPVSIFDARYQTRGSNYTPAQLNGGQLAGFRNKIINGNFVIDQRNLGSLVTIPANSLIFPIDRWICVSAGGASTALVLRNPAQNGQNIFRITGSGGVTSTTMSQRIESFNSYDLAGRRVTLSFSTSNSLRNLVAWEIYIASSENNWSSIGTAIASGNITISPTLTRYSVSFDVPPTGANGIQISLRILNQSSGNWVLSDVQLEGGEISTPYENRTMSVENILCKRYFQYIPLNMIGVATGPSQFMEVPVQFPVSMRSTPILGPLTANPGVSPFQTNLLTTGVSRLTNEWAGTYIQSVGAGQFMSVGYRYSLESELN